MNSLPQEYLQLHPLINTVKQTDFKIPYCATLILKKLKYSAECPSLLKTITKSLKLPKKLQNRIILIIHAKTM